MCRKYIGVDLHSDCFSCHIIYDDGRKAQNKFYIVELERFKKLLDQETYVMVEASSNTFEFVSRLTGAAHSITVADPRKLKLISMVKKKTDKIDAEKLAIFLKMQITSGEDLIRPVYIPPKEVRDLRSLFVTYQAIRKQITMTKNRMHALLRQNLINVPRRMLFTLKGFDKLMKMDMDEILRFQLMEFAAYLAQQEGLCQKIKNKILEKGTIFKREIEILTSMKGLSVFTALAIMSDVVCVERFPNAKHFTSYLRSAPGVDSSNETTRNLKTNKFGRKLSVKLLTQSLNHFRDSNLKLHKWYGRLEAFKPKGKIRMGMCRKILTEIFQMLKKQEYHHFCDPINHQEKMKEYDTFLKKMAA